MTLKFEVITPVLLRRGSIQENKTTYYYSDISGASIKGILRWWFRFLLGGKISEEFLLRAEERVFGSTEKSVGASPVAIFPRVEGNLVDWERVYLRGPPFTYFKKFRLSLKRNQGVKVLMKGAAISVELAQNRMDVENKGDIFKIYELLFEAISLFGGIGPGWRRTLGSIQIEGKSSVKGAVERINQISEEILEKLEKMGIIIEDHGEGICFPNLQGSKFYVYNRRFEDPLMAVEKGIWTLLQIRRILKGRRDPVARALFGYPLRGSGIDIREVKVKRIPSPFIMTVKRVGNSYSILAILSEYLGNCHFTVSYRRMLKDVKDVKREAPNAFRIIENAVRNAGFRQI